MQNQDKWEPCPRCGSNKVESRGGCFFSLLGFTTIGVFIWIAIFIPFIGIPGILFGVGLLIFSPFAKGFLQCKDCNKSWKYPSGQNQTAASEENKE